ncbi:hypothetical protein AMS68_005590 [Peltaster fructicola]|uniref:Telomerase reverse transcriptase n=1 Tax=Peltaster fructicola TaxID=286661 RepID=A0A6H0XZ90_9PEZI|nr:hypothetical protein AMS68_005590 [Peltaster fructicola]
MKRKRSHAVNTAAIKRPRIDKACTNNKQTTTLLRQYYTNVCTLRQYLLCRLPDSARRRRRRLLKYGVEGIVEQDSSLAREVHLLDNIIVGSHKYVPLDELEIIDRDITVFTQQQSGIVDFCIWKLMRTNTNDSRAVHLLCHGAQPRTFDNGLDAQARRIMSLKQHPWTILSQLLGNDSERILCDMFLECGIFQPFDDTSNMIQLSGKPLTELKQVCRQVKQMHSIRAAAHNAKATLPEATPYCRLSDIRITRHRMLYGRPDRSPDGRIRLTLGRKHVLSRLINQEDESENVHLAKYIFPHQFDLQNVFSAPDAHTATMQSLRTSDDRDIEIVAALDRMQAKLGDKVLDDARLKTLVPRRLKGGVLQLVRRIRMRHKRAAFRYMYEYYCPRRTVPALDDSIALAIPDNMVVAFCQAAVLNVFGAECFGSVHNRRCIEAKINHFVRLRRYENVSVHDLLDGIRIAEVKWLAPQRVKPGARLSRTDFDRRKELMAELLYFVFDSFLVPLIKGHFHVTESSVHRNRLFYFRHDTWAAMCEPAIRDMKANMLEECGSSTVQKAETSRSIGVNFVRMIPKERGMRPIINLRRAMVKQQRGRTTYGRSINSLLQPAFQAMNWERSIRPHLTGDAMFSVDDMLPQLQAFRKSLQRQGLADAPLYFAKIDVQGCFDSLPQDKLMLLVSRVLERTDYAIKRFSRVKLLSGHNKQTPGFGAKPSWKYLLRACERGKQLALDDIITCESKDGRVNSIYVDGRAQGPQSRATMLDILQEHIESNIISIGNRMYRQRKGIAQGSIVSSLLCNLLYSQMEHEALAFTNRPDSKLLRLIDDFLLITPDRTTAEQFMQTMHAGIAEYGVQVKVEKSRANFDVAIGGVQIARVPSVADFAYCGHTINTVTLDLGKDHERAKKNNTADGVTVEHSKMPGQSFYRKTLNALQMQMHGMLISTAHNAVETVLANLFRIFTGVAQKTYHYVHSLPAKSKPAEKLVIRAITDAIKLAHKLVKRCRSRSVSDDLCGVVSTAQTRWLACKAFVDVLQQRQARHGKLLAWLQEEMRSKALRGLDRQLLPIVQRCT